MRRILASIIGILCICPAAWAQYPTITATVTATADSVVYNYTLTNTTAYGLTQLAIFMPGGAADTITSHTTSQIGWYTLIRKAGFDMINWDWNETSVIEPGNTASFSFTTAASVPTTYTFGGGTSSDTNNWDWLAGHSSGGEGNTILPVPAPVPEPSSLLALGAGLLPLAVGVRRRGRRN